MHFRDNIVYRGNEAACRPIILAACGGKIENYHHRNVVDEKYRAEADFKSRK